MIYHTPSRGPDTNALKRGLAKALELAKNAHGKQFAYTAHSQQNLRNSILPEAIGEDAVKKLSKENQISISGCKMHLITPRLAGSGFVRGPILAAFISSEFLNRVLKDSRATDIIYIPWAPEELEEFLEKNPNSQKI